MSLSFPCLHCTHEIPEPASCCPHCGRTLIYWNVLATQEPDELAALEQRYLAAKADANSSGSTIPLQDFENATANSKAVIARDVSEVLRLAVSPRQLYANYYELIEGGIRLPDGDDWDMLRQLADTLLFPHSKEEIRFGALSLNELGLTNYGSCSIVLRENMIAHRSSVFEENSALFMEHRGVSMSRKTKVPPGYRANWADRGKLCVSKLGSRISAASTPADFSGILLKQGVTSGDDDFIEVHIWGPMSIFTIEKVVVDPKLSKRAATIRALKTKLIAYKVTVM